MIKWLIEHQWRETTRSAIWEKSLVVSILLAALMGYMALNFLALGVFSPEIVQAIFPDDNVTLKFTQLWIYYLLFDLLFRLWMQEFPLMTVRHYMYLPVSRSKITHSILLRSLTSAFNWMPLFLLFPFFLRVVILEYGLTGAVFWLVSMMTLTLISNFLANILKRTLGKRPWIPMVTFVLIAALCYLDMTEVINFSGGIGLFLFQALPHSWMFVSLMLVLIAVYIWGFKLLKQAMYLDDLSMGKEGEINTIGFDFFSHLGAIGSLIQLELKLIWRNKRPKASLLIGLFSPVLFLGLLMMEEIQSMGMYVLMFGIMISSYGMLVYGQFLVAWESSYFDFIQTKNILRQDYLTAKYYLLSFLCLVTLVYVLPAFFFSFELGLRLMACLVFNMGVSTFIILFFANYNSKPVDLTKGTFLNYEGTGASQFLLMIPIFLLPMAIYFPVAIFISPTMGIAALAIVGILGIFFHPFILKQIERLFNKRRYDLGIAYKDK